MRFFASRTRRADEATPLLKRGGGGGERVGTRTWLERRGSFLAVLSFLLALGTVSGGGKTVVSFLSRQGQTAAQDLEYVEWTNLRGVTTANKLGYLKRIAGGHGWNQGAHSARAITKVGDEIRGISADCMRRDRRLMVGLSHRPGVNHDFKTIDFAIYCDQGDRWNPPKIHVFESGSKKKTLAPLVSGETVQIALNDDGFIAYYVDGELKYTSTKRPSFPLYADASLENPHAELANVMWVANVASPTVVAQ